jgi:hypothetical protein
VSAGYVQDEEYVEWDEDGVPVRDRRKALQKAWGSRRGCMRRLMVPLGARVLRVVV